MCPAGDLEVLLATLKTVRKNLSGRRTSASSSTSSESSEENSNERSSLDTLREKYGSAVVRIARDEQQGVGERIAAQMAAQLLMSLEGFHANGIILRDVKEDNVMLMAKG